MVTGDSRSRADLDRLVAGADAAVSAVEQMSPEEIARLREALDAFAQDSGTSST